MRRPVPPSIPVGRPADHATEAVSNPMIARDAPTTRTPPAPDVPTTMTARSLVAWVLGMFRAAGDAMRSILADADRLSGARQG